MTTPVTCDPTLRDRQLPAGVNHDYEYIGDEYGSLADGGSYEVFRCRVCGRVAYGDARFVEEVRRVGGDDVVAVRVEPHWIRR